MDFGNLILSPTAIVYAVAAIAVLGLGLWWLVRKRHTRVWLPPLRVMQLESRLLPRLLLRVPPLLAFLCFLIAALVMTGFSLKPRRQVYTPYEPNQTRIHIFLDLSPSMTASLNKGQLGSSLRDIWDNLQDSGRVTVSSTLDAQIFEPKTGEEVVDYGNRQGFHRPGARLGNVLKNQWEDIGEVDRILIVSDGDQHSWNGFNWRYLTDEMDVQFIDLGEALESRTNFFISEAQFLSTPTSQTMEWDVEIARRGDLSREDSGKITVKIGATELGVFPFSIESGKQRATIRASWPAAKVPAAMAVESEPIIWTLSTNVADALPMDNEFRTSLLGLKRDVLIVAEPAGERIIEDPVHSLEVGLEVLGFKLKRLDTLEQPGPDPASYPLWIIFGGTGGGTDMYCPRSLEVARLARQGKQGAKAPATTMPKVWLMPSTVEADFEELCQCYVRLMTSEQAGATEGFCQNVTSRNQWIGLLPSLGAKQIGGDLGDATGSLAFHGRDGGSGLEVLAFTVPLSASGSGVLDHAQLPMLLKQILEWQDLLAASGGRASYNWPRLSDISLLQTEVKDPEEIQKQLLSNVPVGESMLARVADEALPPRWTTRSEYADSTPARKDREDPLPWLKLGAFFLVCAMALEAIVSLMGRVVHFMSGRQAAMWLLFVLGAALSSEGAWAKVEMGIIGPGLGPTSFNQLAREVAHRTSLELEVRPDSFAEVTEQALLSPWLFVTDLQAVSDHTGMLRSDVALWIKRGGLLVLQGQATDDRLELLTKRLKTDILRSTWQAIPPDHELLRSFYLLDSLPMCFGNVWRGYHYDSRLSILAVPFNFVAHLKDTGSPSVCDNPVDQERSVRIFVNLVMVALATDYKKDQIHLPEILKRLR